MIQVKFVKLHPNAKLPERASEGAAGYDVYLPQEVVLQSNMRKLVPLGFALEIPAGFEAQIRPRSSLAKSDGLTIVNSPATIDSDYRGEVGVILKTPVGGWFAAKKGDRIAQLVFARVEEVQFEIATELEPTRRGAGGFGSTGKGMIP